MKHVVQKISVTMGLGDAILSFIQALAYAQITGRVLHVDWRGGWYGMPARENVFDRLFEVHGLEYSSDLPDDEAVVPGAWEGRLTNTFTQTMEEDSFEARSGKWNRQEALRRYSADLCAQEYTENIVITWDHYQVKRLLPKLTETAGVARTSTNIEAMGQIFNRFVRLKPDLQRQLDDFWAFVARGEHHSKILGVHVRETNESFAVYGPISRKRYFAAVDRFLRKRGGPEVIFLATDNSDVVEAFQEYYGDAVRAKAKWFDAPGNPLHLATSGRANNWNNLLDAIYEMYALSRCGYLVRRRESSFSRVSEAIGLIPGNRVALMERDWTWDEGYRRVITASRKAVRSVRCTIGGGMPRRNGR